MRNYFYHIRLCLFIIAGLLAVSHAAAGNNNDENSQEPFYTANKAVLEKMNTGQPITVIGHKNQDPDAVCAAISFAALLRELNINASKSFPIDKACSLVRNVMPTKLGMDGATMIFANIADRESQTTHIPYCGTGAKEVAEAAFDTTTHDNCITVPRLLTRKSDFVPAITKVLRNK